MNNQLVLPIAPLTDRQKLVLDFVKGYIKAHGYAPSRKDICQHFSFQPNSAQYHISALVRKGYLFKAKGVGRGLTLPKNNEL